MRWGEVSLEFNIVLVFSPRWERRGITHCVVFPVSNCVVVMARWPQAGQSAGAGERLRFIRGVAFW